MRTRSRSTSRSWTPRLPRSSARAPSRSATRRPCGRWEMPWSRGCGPEGWRRRRHAPCRRPSWAPTPMAQSMFRRGPLCLQGPLWLTYLPLSAGARFSVRLACCAPDLVALSILVPTCRHPHRRRRRSPPYSALAAFPPCIRAPSRCTLVTRRSHIIQRCAERHILLSIKWPF